MPNTLTKADIIEAIQKENGDSRKQSAVKSRGSVLET